MGTTNFAPSQNHQDVWPKNGHFCPKKLSQAHIGLAGSFNALLVGGCGARAVSRKTHIYFIYNTKKGGQTHVQNLLMQILYISKTLMSRNCLEIAVSGSLLVIISQ